MEDTVALQHSITPLLHKGGNTMFFLDLLFVLVITLIFTGIFAAGFRRQRAWNDFLWFFVILFFMTWAFGGWLTPFWPTFFGVFWGPFFITALLIALLLTSFTEPRPPRNARERAIQEEEAKNTRFVLDAFFWVLIIGLIVVIIIRYIR